jgi:hypothetical protein
MTDREEKLRELLGKVFRPPANAGPSGDLWPRMLRKLDEGERRWPWLDWVLVAVAAAWIVVFPEVIPSLLYHL